MKKYGVVYLVGVAIVALFDVISIAHAQVYKCTIDGKVVYQGSPCDGGAKLNLSHAGKPDPNTNASEHLKREAARLRRRAMMETDIAEGSVRVGMTSDDVLDSWGRPTTINSTLNSGGRSEQWVYRRAGIGNSQYVYITNGVVTTIQSSK